IDLVLIDEVAGARDLVVDTTAARKRLAFGEQRAIAAFGEFTGAQAEGAMLILMAETQLRQRIFFGPAFELRRIELRYAFRPQRVVAIGESAVMRELRLDALDPIEQLVTIDRDVDIGGTREDVLHRTQHHAAAIHLADARAPELLEALPRQPEAIGLAVADRRGPIGAHHLGL